MVLSTLEHKILNDEDFLYDVNNLSVELDFYIKNHEEFDKCKKFDNSFFLSMSNSLCNQAEDRSTIQLIITFFKFIVEKVKFTPYLNLFQSKQIEKLGYSTNSLLHSTISSSVKSIMESKHWESDLKNTPELFYSLAFLLPYLHAFDNKLVNTYIIIEKFVELNNKFDNDILDKVSNALYLMYNSGEQDQEDVFLLTLRVMIAANGLHMERLKSYFIEMYSDYPKYHDTLIYDQIKDKIQNSIQQVLLEMQFQSHQEIVSIIDSIVKNAFPDLTIGVDEKKKIEQKVEDLRYSNERVRDIELKLKILKRISLKEISKNLYSWLVFE